MIKTRKIQPRDERRAHILKIREERFVAAFSTEAERIAYLTTRIERCKRV